MNLQVWGFIFKEAMRSAARNYKTHEKRGTLDRLTGFWNSNEALIVGVLTAEAAPQAPAKPAPGISKETPEEVLLSPAERMEISNEVQIKFEYDASEDTNAQLLHWATVLRMDIKTKLSPRSSYDEDEDEDEEGDSDQDSASMVHAMFLCAHLDHNVVPPRGLPGTLLVPRQLLPRGAQQRLLVLRRLLHPHPVVTMSQNQQCGRQTLMDLMPLVLATNPTLLPRSPNQRRLPS